MNAADAGQRLKTKLAARKGRAGAAAAAGRDGSGGGGADGSLVVLSPARARGGRRVDGGDACGGAEGGSQEVERRGGDGAEAAPLSRPRASAPVAAGIGRVAPV